MGKIVILDENTSNQIAAGEVIERPASIVKEMVENALDAGATSVTVEIINGGIKSIRITDNGAGIEADDVEMAFERHATSKLRKIDDLNTLSTMGFRGEALASIASVAKVEAITKTEGANIGTKLIIEGGTLLANEPIGAPKGTTFIVRELFFNTPARYKFLKKDATEAGHIQDILTRIALARPDVSIKFISQGKTVLHTPGNHDLLSVIYSVYGKEIAKSVLPLNTTAQGLQIDGYVGKPEIARGNRSFQSILINGRFVYNRIITAALEEAYKTRLMQKRFPFAVLRLTISPQFVDVNVHPAKLEVRFSDEQKVFRTVYHTVSEALLGASMIPHVEEKAPQVQLHGKQMSAGKGFAAGHEQKKDTWTVVPASQASTRNVPEVFEAPQVQVKNAGVEKPAFPAQSQNSLQQINQVREKTENISPVRNGFAEKPESSADTVPNTAIPNEPVNEISYPVILPDKSRIHEIEAVEQVDVIESKSTLESEPMADDRQKLLQARVLGQAFESFILLEHGEEMLLVDQHAAHERIRYEKLKKQYTANDAFSQTLLSAVAVHMTDLEIAKFHDLSTYFEKFGFEAEDFGSKTILIRAIPYVLQSSFSGQDFLEILDKLSREVTSVSEIIPEETLYMMACKSAIKANRTMSVMEIEALIRELVETENPYTCVHGRPIIISMTKREMEKRFKRIV